MQDMGDYIMSMSVSDSYVINSVKVASSIVCVTYFSLFNFDSYKCSVHYIFFDLLNDIYLTEQKKSLNGVDCKKNNLRYIKQQ